MLAYWLGWVGFGLDKVVKTLENGTEFSLGGDVMIAHNSDMGGTVQPFVNVAPNFDVLNYSYTVNSVVLLAKTSMYKSHLFGNKWGGYIQGGLGGAINALSDYSEITPPDSSAGPMISPFGDKSKAAFAFSLGVGLTRTVNHTATLMLGYQYLNTGSGVLAPTLVQQTTQQFSSSSLGHHLFNISIKA